MLFGGGVGRPRGTFHRRQYHCFPVCLSVTLCKRDTDSRQATGRVYSLEKMTIRTRLAHQHDTNEAHCSTNPQRD